MTNARTAATTGRPARAGWIAPRSGGYTPKAADRPRTDPPQGRGASSTSNSGSADGHQ